MNRSAIDSIHECPRGVPVFALMTNAVKADTIAVVRPHLITVACAILFLICMGTLLLWLRTFAVADYLHCDAYPIKSGVVYRNQWDFESAGGQVGLWFAQISNSDPAVVRMAKTGTHQSIPRGAAWRWERDMNPDGPSKRVWLWRGKRRPVLGFGMQTYPRRTSGFYGHREWSVIVQDWFVI